jgi:hypothetical protein
MYKIFILLFIIFIINYFLLGIKEHYEDIKNSEICKLNLSKFETNLGVEEIKAKCPKPTTAPH